MTQTIQRKLNDSAFVRWAAVILISLMMFFAYMFVDILSPMKANLESDPNLMWNSTTYGTYGASEYFLNVFFFFLIFAGIILDKMGIRFTGLLSASLMVIGAGIKYYAVSDAFATSELNVTMTSWGLFDLPGTALLACVGFMIFGCGCEMAGTTVSKAIAKWFKGKEMAMAMGLEMSIARLGVFAAMWLSPIVYKAGGSEVSSPVLFGTILLMIGLIFYFVFCVMDTKFDKQLKAAGELSEEGSEEEFKFSDLKNIFTSKMFWLVALMCVLYYSAIFPFQKFAPDFLAKTLKVEPEVGAQLFSFFPILAMCLTPFLGGFIDRKGKAASMLMVGSMIMIACHLCFAFLLPAFPSQGLAVAIIAILGVSFSLVPAALWPSVPKIIDERILGSAYCVIFWIQNIGLLAVPIVIGAVNDATGSYVLPMIIFSSFGVLALFIGMLLKREDTKKGYGLELPNIKK
ncbi:MAG: major facilitator superfamily domain-containing protein 1 [Rikenellaceae bacterium]|nr:major facilitator superfamily domain-containing protein 1 [Rikenellaceae bacterium]